MWIVLFLLSSQDLRQTMLLNKGFVDRNRPDGRLAANVYLDKVVQENGPRFEGVTRWDGDRLECQAGTVQKRLLAASKICRSSC